MSIYTKDTIAAIATAPGRGGVGIVRISGPKALEISESIAKLSPTPRHAHFATFKSSDGSTLDEGIVLSFPGPHSFTGEDVVELQGHGGPVILDHLLKEVLDHGARMARPGEFSERAFLNDKLDLAQAEAIADLIDANSHAAAAAAMNSLQGVFSQKVHGLVESLIALRIYVEAAIDFPEEEIDFLTDGKVENDLRNILSNLEGVQHQARQGTIIREGMNVVIAGRPNAGKSSLLNALAGKDSAIVTNIAGTTRDVLREHIHIDGMPLHIIDTAGLRDSPDEVERIGIERAWEEIHKADRILMVVDSQAEHPEHPRDAWPEFFDKLERTDHLSLVYNKIDLSNLSNDHGELDGVPCFFISAKQGEGLVSLKEHLKNTMGFQGTTEGTFTARRRHLEALQIAKNALDTGLTQLFDHAAGELLAEDLRAAQNALSEITGEFTSDDLLGRIFSSFCIGK
ncbi:tRNA uridine-5-carboxymethylaminomethyl(34) synthesis GTPase MnmE [Marinibactrum halimedae]|uniref:tRNA modification GTPase MnmE n=1 Tax=Marinibactrum halimedae TaxID=1444977 RepID=A0AA37T9I1_9GAMM|nr:tRNA uridine-5-carboxymethylaminomethyl(34) synthesis GTPase MnmE [Marinibactrum halimedae]MCD9460014.1 tRNA uridine-5-carboxymethylaminomethyl(34) synthesis GTPase MnmE [Marinibactrum halimedae]GLS28216.1 tRNA modification GTPase MnmE [Marinibactrum halimedae]